MSITANPIAGTAANPPERGGLITPASIVGLLVALACSTAMLVIAMLRDAGVVDPDGAYYLNIARQLAAGHGFSSNSLWLMWLDPPSLPYPAATNSPIYPLLVAGLLRFTSDPVWAAHAINFPCFLVLIGLVYGTARHLGLSSPISALSAVSTACAPIVWGMAGRPGPDIIGITLAFVTLLLANSERRGLRVVLASVTAALAYLTREQMGMVLPALLLAHLLRAGGLREWRSREFLRDAVTTGALFLVVCLPWLLRNVMVFGTPFKNLHKPSFVLLGFEDAGRDTPWLSQSTTHPPPLTYLLSHLPSYFVGCVVRMKELTKIWPDHGSVFCALAALAVVVAANVRRFAPAYFLAGASAAFFVVTYYELRYMAMIFPLMSLLAGLGLDWLLRRMRGIPHERALSVILVVVMLTFTLREAHREAKYQPFVRQRDVALLKLKHELDRTGRTDAVVMGGLYADLVGFMVQRNSVAFPITDVDGWWRVVRKYHAEYLAVTAEELEKVASPEWRASVMPKLQSVWQEPATGLQLYRIPGDSF